MENPIFDELFFQIFEKNIKSWKISSYAKKNLQNIFHYHRGDSLKNVQNIFPYHRGDS